MNLKKQLTILCITILVGSVPWTVSQAQETLNQSIEQSSQEGTYNESTTSTSTVESTTATESSESSNASTSNASTSNSATINNVESSQEEVSNEQGRLGFPNGRSDLYQSPAPRIELPIIPITNTNTPRKDVVDVSSHNGLISVAVFQTMKAYGVKGVVVKLTEGTTYVNPLAESQIKNAKAAGLIVSAFHFSWFTTDSEAAEEALYFSTHAQRLGLDKNTVMVNDIEEPKIKGKGNPNHTSNSIAFERKLNQLGYKRVVHYVGQNWLNEGLIDGNALGKKKIWTAAYPYAVDTTNYYTDYGAWQWSSKMTVPGSKAYFDVSVDYNQLLIGNPQGPYIPDGRYVTVTTKGYPVWSDFEWKNQVNATDNLQGQTFLAKGRYHHVNGATYFSLYDANGTWKGYVNSYAVSIASSPGGIYNADGRYVTVTTKGYPLWNDFNWIKKKNNTDNLYQKTYIAKGRYRHINGATYFSLFNSNGVWQGYVNAEATTVADGPGGIYNTDGRYVTVSKKGYPLWNDFKWVKKLNSTDNLHKKTFIARGRYHHVNGSTYFSLFNSNGVWQGYVNAEATTVANGPGGIYHADPHNVVVRKKGYPLWNDFGWKKKKSTTDKLYNQTLLAKGYYNHVNGARYYSLFNGRGVWQGYVNTEAVINK